MVEAYQHKETKRQRQAAQPNWEAEEAAGLFRTGIHTDTKIVATKPDGEQVEINVLPVPVNKGRDTRFVPQPLTDILIFNPPKPRGNI